MLVTFRMHNIRTVIATQWPVQFPLYSKGSVHECQHNNSKLMQVKFMHGTESKNMTFYFNNNYYNYYYDSCYIYYTHLYESYLCKMFCLC